MKLCMLLPNKIPRILFSWSSFFQLLFQSLRTWPFFSVLAKEKVQLCISIGTLPHQKNVFISNYSTTIMVHGIKKNQSAANPIKKIFFLFIAAVLSKWCMDHRKSLIGPRSLPKTIFLFMATALRWTGFSDSSEDL